jgi:hypothetical protein
MLEFDSTYRTALAADRAAALAAAYDRTPLRRRVGLRLVAIGLRLAEPRPAQAAGSAAAAA